MGTLAEAIPEELRALERWVCADRDSKRPMRPFDGGPASVSDPATWGSYEDARRCVEEGIYEYMGFVFADDGYVGIDIDHAFEDSGLLSDEALDAVTACQSYAEVSKSGNGIHIVCRGSLPFRGRNNRAGWEIYREARFFVLTGSTVVYRELRDAQEGIDMVLSEHFADTPRDGGGSTGPRILQPTWVIPEGSRVPLWPRFPTVGSGSRHISLVSYCGQAWSAGASEASLLRMASVANRRFMDPPLEDAEVEQIARSVTRYRR